MNLQLTRQNIWIALVSFTLCSFAFSERLSSWGIALLILFFFVDKNLIQKISRPFQLSKLWAPVGFFIIYIIFYLFSDKDADAAHSLTSKASFFILPLLFSYESYFNKKNESIILMLFSIALSVGFLYELSSSLYINYFNSTTPKLAAAFSRMQISKAIMHPGYYSNYFMLGIIWHYFSKNKWSPFFITLFTIVLILLLSRIVLLFYAVFFIYAAFRNIKKSKKPFLAVCLASLLIIIIGFGVYQIPTIKNRVNNTISGISSDNKKTDVSDATAARSIAYKSEIELIKNKPILGYGMGNAVEVLKKQLRAAGYTALAEDMHVHNQYFNNWLQNGLPGILILLILLVFFLSYFYNLNNWTGCWFTVLVCMNLITDDMLEIQAGIVFFVLVWSLYLFQEKEITSP